MGGADCRELVLLAGGEGAAGVLLGPGPGGRRGLPFVLAVRIRAQGHRVGFPGARARPRAAQPGMCRGCTPAGPAAPGSWARGNGAEHEEVHGAQVLLRVPAQEVALQELQSESPRGKGPPWGARRMRFPAAPQVGMSSPEGVRPPAALTVLCIITLDPSVAWEVI